MSSLLLGLLATSQPGLLAYERTPRSRTHFLDRCCSCACTEACQYVVLPFDSYQAPDSEYDPRVTAAGGAYRPPHARGTLTPSVYKREDEGGAAYDSNGANPFPRDNGRETPGGFGGRNARRGIPGAPPPGAPVNAEDPLANRRKKKGGDKKGKGNKGQQQQAEDGAGSSTPASGTATPAPVPELPPPVPEVPAVEPSLSPEDKKRRAIVKKLTAIEQLKSKKAAGEKLELTQHKKLER